MTFQQSAMLNFEASDTEKVSAWLRAALDAGKPRGLSNTGLAAHCKVTPQAVSGWLKTGRISKSKLALAATYFGHAPNFIGPTVLMERAANYGDGWPFKRIARESISKLTPTDLSFIEGKLAAALEQLAAEAATSNTKRAGRG